MNNNNRTVLHIDDDPQILRIVGEQLLKFDFNISSCGDPTKAIELLLQQEIRVVLLDIDMPNKNGLDLLKEIKAFDGGIQVIMLTGLSAMSTVLQSLRLGAEACFFKPITDIQPIVGALNSAFEKIDRWWNTLNDLSSRRRIEQTTR